MKEQLKTKCPSCRKETYWENNSHRPFCSERCRLIDLGQWADESYRIPDRQPMAEELDNLIAFPDNDNKDDKE